MGSHSAQEHALMQQMTEDIRAKTPGADGPPTKKVVNYTINEIGRRWTAAEATLVSEFRATIKQLAKYGPGDKQTRYRRLARLGERGTQMGIMTVSYPDPEAPAEPGRALDKAGTMIAHGEEAAAVYGGARAGGKSKFTNAEIAAVVARIEADTLLRPYQKQAAAGALRELGHVRGKDGEPVLLMIDEQSKLTPEIVAYLEGRTIDVSTPEDAALALQDNAERDIELRTADLDAQAMDRLGIVPGAQPDLQSYRDANQLEAQIKAKRSADDTKRAEIRATCEAAKRQPGETDESLRGRLANECPADVLSEASGVDLTNMAFHVAEFNAQKARRALLEERKS